MRRWGEGRGREQGRERHLATLQTQWPTRLAEQGRKGPQWGKMKWRRRRRRQERLRREVRIYPNESSPRARWRGIDLEVRRVLGKRKGRRKRKREGKGDLED